MVPAMQIEIGRAWLARRRWILLVAVLAVGMGWKLPALFRPAPPRASIRVSQVGREFKPDRLTLAQGGSVRVANDDADLTHHAYVASAKFSFDSGDQAPGRDVEITFSVPGTFQVLCGIHPKMRLSVFVR